MYNIALAYLQNATKGIQNVISTVEKLSKLGTIQQVQSQKHIIEKVMSEEFWESSDIFELDEVSNNSIYNANELKDYKKKIEQHYLNFLSN